MSPEASPKVCARTNLQLSSKPAYAAYDTVTATLLEDMLLCKIDLHFTDRESITIGGPCKALGKEHSPVFVATKAV